MRLFTPIAPSNAAKQTNTHSRSLAHEGDSKKCKFKRTPSHRHALKNVAFLPNYVNFFSEKTNSYPVGRPDCAELYEAELKDRGISVVITFPPFHTIALASKIGT